MENQNARPSDETTMGILSYIGPLVLIPLITAKDKPFVKFHIKQGLVLLVLEVVLGVLSASMFMAFWAIYNLLNLALLVLSILGIVNVINGKEEPLPVIGDFSKHFNI